MSVHSSTAAPSASPSHSKTPTPAPSTGKGAPPAKPSSGPSTIPVATVSPTGSYYPYTLVPPSNADYQLPHGTITRAEIITRAKTWVAEHVPYSQTEWYTDSDGTYRQDCSGYVSMVWALDQYTDFWTGNLNLVSHTIPAAALLPGDILLSVKHTIIFAGWADAQHTQFDYFEEAHPGTFARYVLDAPLSAFLDNGFATFRYDGVLDSGALPADPTDGIPYSALVQQGSEVDPAGVLSGKLAGLNAEDRSAGNDGASASAKPPVIAAQAAADISDGPNRRNEGLALGALGVLLVGAGLFIRKPVKALQLPHRRGKAAVSVGQGGESKGGSKAESKSESTTGSESKAEPKGEDKGGSKSESKADPKGE